MHCVCSLNHSLFLEDDSRICTAGGSTPFSQITPSSQIAPSIQPHLPVKFACTFHSNHAFQSLPRPRWYKVIQYVVRLLNAQTAALGPAPSTLIYVFGSPHHTANLLISNRTIIEQCPSSLAGRSHGKLSIWRSCGVLKDLSAQSSKLKHQASSINPQMSNFKPQTSVLKPQISGFKVACLQIFQSLGPADLLQVAQVCQSWHSLSSSNLLWRPICQATWQLWGARFPNPAEQGGLVRPRCFCQLLRTARL